MMSPIQIHFLSLLLLVWHAHGRIHSEAELNKYILGEYERNASAICTESVSATWAYETDITDANSERVTMVTLKAAAIEKEIYDEWFKDVRMSDIRNDTLRRMLKGLRIIGGAVLDNADLKQLTEINSKMTNIYSTAKICPYRRQQCTQPNLNLEPEIEHILATSTDYDELAYVWQAWRDATGKQMRPLYPKYVALSNKVGVGNGFADYGAYWRDQFDTEHFVEIVDELWTQVRPLYKQLHAYAKNKLVTRYGKKLDAKDGLLPAHVFGNMWAQSWGNLEELLKPYPRESEVNITKTLIQRRYTVPKLFSTSDEFYTSLGLPTNAVSFGPKSMITRPVGKEVLCHASAWDFCNKEDWLIKMCTKLNQEDFITVHHEMGHIQYYILYKDQPVEFREGANPGFHEAVGDTMALSVQSIKHLKAIGLLANDYKDSKEADINTLLSMALEKIAFMPFGLLIDKWRWDIFAGKVPEEKWNDYWWELRAKYQLIKPPVERKPDDFDPASKFHVAGDSQYISYFVSHILQFQFYRGLCIAAGQYNPETKSPPLHQCDFYKSVEAGDLLKRGLSLGSSRPWPEVLEIIAGTEKMDASALLEYFAPLSEYFTEHGYNSAQEHSVSWPLFFCVIALLRIFY